MANYENEEENVRDNESSFSKVVIFFLFVTIVATITFFFYYKKPINQKCELPKKKLQKSRLTQQQKEKLITQFNKRLQSTSTVKKLTNKKTGSRTVEQIMKDRQLLDYITKNT